ncbi:MAG: nucleotidyltransferase family protein [Bacteroidaceae bacterium]|nr:nucleotidyltransferase family protein [Bacteroidaceae bacterium]
MVTKRTYWTFIRYCLDEQQCIPIIEDWDALFLFMKEQTLLGVGFCGVERMKAKGIDIPKPLFLRWYALSERIKACNALMNRRCTELAGKLSKDGFRYCILKGQGNSLLYPDPYMRTPGDIDVFVMRTEGASVGERRREVMDYVRECFPETKIRYQHIDYPVFKDVLVEMHFVPTTMNNPVYNRRIQRWAEAQMPQQCWNFVRLSDNAGTIAVPTADFNVIYQLSHLMHHFFDEGIGLRQMMDYYFVLKTRSGVAGNGTEEKMPLERGLRHLGLYKFAGAVMYILREVFGLEESLMIVPEDERRGKTLMADILKGGNFGKYSGLTRHSMGVKHFLKIRRNLHFVREYPAEAICEPVFRTLCFFWRIMNR